MKTFKTKWTIAPDQSLFDLKLHNISRYRHLVYSLAHRDITAFYQQTILGPIWIVINPLLTTTVFTIIFGKLASFSNGRLPGPLFYLSGVIMWNFFSECLNRISNVFKDNQILFGKVYFPRLVIPLSILLSMLFRFGIQFVVFCLGLLFFQLKNIEIQINETIMLVPVLLLLMAIQALGIGITMAALTVKYRDLSLLLSFVVQLLMYTTPVIYPLSAMPPGIRSLMVANPMTPLIETFRFAFLGIGIFSWSSLFQCALTSFLLLFIGLAAFQRAARNFIDII